MATNELTVREHSTAYVDMTLKADGTAINLTGVDHIEMQMVDVLGKVYRYSEDDSPAYLSVVTAASGTIRFQPPATTTFQHVRSPYRLYILVYETASRYYSVPGSGYNEITVTKEY